MCAFNGFQRVPAPFSLRVRTQRHGFRARAHYVPSRSRSLFPASTRTGMDAGRAFNTFPLMAGQWVPEEYWDLWDRGYGFRNFFENTAAVQVRLGVSA